jgi:predicted GH43/DUF377 family glycosyl hydrolase
MANCFRISYLLLCLAPFCSEKVAVKAGRTPELLPENHIKRSQCAHSPPYPACPNEYPQQHKFLVTVLDRNPYNGQPLIEQSQGDSQYKYNFNGPWFPTSAETSTTLDGLIVRVQEDWRSPNATHREWTDTGALAVIIANLTSGETDFINESSIFWPGVNAPPPLTHECEHAHPLCSWGAIDPRISYRPHTQEYYLTWDNCTFECASRSSMLSVSKNPFNHDSWVFVGPIIPNMQTAGVSLLFQDDVNNSDATHLAFISSYNCFTISLAESMDGLNWNITEPNWMQGRQHCWDACGTIAGPQPERLTSGDFLFIYNIDTEAAGKGNDTKPLGRCTIGWAILDGTNPRKIVARSSTAIITPQMPWETTSCAGNSTEQTCQTPDVIFATGLKPLGKDTFLIIYGGGDTDTAAIKIKVSINSDENTLEREFSNTNCVADAGDYWVSDDGYLRRNYNCSGTASARNIWKILNNEGKHAIAQYVHSNDACTKIKSECILQPPQFIQNSSCDDSCYDFCWKKDVGDCADFDDEQSLCVSLCQDYCVATRCGSRSLSTCERSCGDRYMVDRGPYSIDFVNYALCISVNCTTVPVSPYQI